MPLNTKHRLIPSLGINTYISMLMGAVLNGRNRPAAPPRRPFRGGYLGLAECLAQGWPRKLRHSKQLGIPFGRGIGATNELWIFGNL